MLIRKDDVLDESLISKMYEIDAYKTSRLLMNGLIMEWAMFLRMKIKTTIFFKNQFDSRSWFCLTELTNN